MRPVYVEAVGVAGPGLPSWRESLAVLRGETPYAASEMAPYAPEKLPPNERRRATPAVRLAFRCAEDALLGTPLAAADLATVFASADGDLDVVHRINTALVQPARAISPTDFHNSVHNAPAGYWSIAVGSKRPSTSLAAHEASFAAGLVEACALVTEDGLDTLFGCYDVRAPAPIATQRPVTQPFAVALVLTGTRTPRTLAALRLGVEARESPLADEALEQLRRDNPAARALPLLVQLAQPAPVRAGVVGLPGTGGVLGVEVTP
ncbi:MAG TPA: beta-ketoacyl synthase chain length factor [Candidatus Binatia bacterium]|nr:beta-ketoacyl synthase chain length factor [Candidatus Binatia bacterium]